MNKNILEQIIGGKRMHHNLTPNSTLNNLFLLSELANQIIIYSNIESPDIIVDNNDPLFEIVGLSFDGNLVGRKTKYYTKIILNESKCFDSIEIQSLCRQAVDAPSCYWQYISYIKIKYNGVEYSIGKTYESDIDHSFKQHLKFRCGPIEYISNKCFISGVGIHNDGIICLQVISFKDNDDSLIDNLVYGKGVTTLIESNIDNKLPKNLLLKENFDLIFGKPKSPDYILDIENFIMDYHMIGIEDPDVLQLFMLVFSRQMRWTSTKQALTVYYPLFTKLIDRVIEEKNYKIIHSVFRLDRTMNYLIYSHENLKSKSKPNPNPQSQPTVFHKYVDLVVKMKHLWSPLVFAMNKCLDITRSQISYNCYHLASLSDNKTTKFFGVITFICQMALMVLLGISFLDKSISQIFPLTEGRVIIPLIFIFTLMISYKQISNSLDYKRIFYGRVFWSANWYDLFDFISNVICSVIIIFFNFFILSFNDKVLDIVLNSVASLFILELDDSVVFDTPDTINNMIRNKLITEFNSDVYVIPEVYFNSEGNKTWINKGVNRLNDKDFEINFNELTIVKKKSLELDELKFNV